MNLEPAASRLQARHTQQEAAQLLGVPKRTWQNWEGGITSIPAQMLLLYRHLAGIERIPYPRRA